MQSVSVQKELQHQIGLHKYCQVRGPKRQLIKAELFNKKAILYKKKVINQQSKFLRFVGKQQNLRSLSTFRKIRSEAKAHFDYDVHPFISTFIMSETNYRHFIQYLATPLKVFLFNLERIEMLFKFEALLLEKANYTLRIDATGSVVEPLKCSNKRIFLYSIIAHIPECKKILPIADAILCNHTSFEIASFLHFCKAKPIN